MIANTTRSLPKWALPLSLLLLASCNRSPSFDILGSFFPAWLLCLVSGLLLTVAAHLLLVRIHVILALPVLTYPSLTALLTCALWLTFFR